MTDDHTPLNLSELTDFQFGPAWARGGAASADFTRLPREQRAERPDRRPRREEGDRRGPRREFRQDKEQRGFRNDRRHDDRRAPRGPRPERGERREAPRRELPQPAEGFRVELRPANSILEVFATKIQEQKRTLPLMDLARVVMGAKNRYDVVFMKMEKGSDLIHSTKGDGACWLTKEEALAYLPKAPWFGEFYTTEQVEVEAPKGTFSGVAVCSLGKEVIGPVNWHGYQAALMNLYRSKYSSMPLDAFKNRISVDKSEEAVAAWMESAAHKTVWKPVREGAGDTQLADLRAVEADFAEHHFADAYETVDKVFINGAVGRELLTPGIAAHIALLSDKMRRFPQMLIPNLCHGMARHHLPIFKWHGNHYTGPSRIRAIAEDTVLADRMTAIINWSKENSGKTCDVMFAELSGVPAGTDEETKKAAADAYAPYVADMIWLLEQGYIVVTGDNAVWFPKGEAAPEAPKAPAPKHGKSNGKKAPAKKPAKKAAPAPAPAAEAPAEAAVPAEAPAAAAEETPAE